MHRLFGYIDGAPAVGLTIRTDFKVAPTDASSKIAS